MPTSDTRTHASMTIPLSRTRSRTSMRLVPPDALSTGMVYPLRFGLFGTWPDGARPSSEFPWVADVADVVDAGDVADIGGSAKRPAGGCAWARAVTLSSN